MAITEIKDGDLVLARHVPDGDAWGEGLKFSRQIVIISRLVLGAMTRVNNCLHMPIMRLAERFSGLGGALHPPRKVRAEIFNVEDLKVAELGNCG